MNEQTKKTQVACVAAGLMALNTFAIAPTPAVWFRADQGVTTNSDGVVTAWANCGTTAGELPGVAPNLADSNIRLVQGGAYFGGAPYVAFPGGARNCLVSSGSTSLGFSTSAAPTGITAIAVFHHVPNRKEPLWGLRSPNASEKRLCQFITAQSAEDNRAMSFLAKTINYNTQIGTLAGDLVFTSIGYDVTARRNVTYINGATRGTLDSGFWDATSRPWSAILEIGENGCGWYQGVAVEIAEIRIYTHPLSASDHFGVLCELAGRYSIDIAESSSYSVPGSLVGDCLQEPVVLGANPSSASSETPSLSGTSGALSISYAPTPGVNNTAIYCAHDGSDGSMRNWCIAGTTAARAFPVTIAFSGAAYANLPRKILQRRDANAHSWSRVDCEATTAGDTVSFTLPAGWENGQYRLCENYLLDNLVAWFRADTGVVTNGAGRVTSWKNIGSLATTGELAELNAVATNAAGASTLTVQNIPALAGRPVVDFPRDGTFLVSPGKTDLDNTGVNVDGGITVFSVHCWRDVNNNSVFTLWDPDLNGPSHNNENRFGMGLNGGKHQLVFVGELDPQYRMETSQEVALSNPLLVSWYTYRTGSTQESRHYAYFNDGARLPLTTGESPNLRFGNRYFMFGHPVGWSEYPGNSVPRFDGYIAEFRLYNRALTSSERALVELELAERYGRESVATVGICDIAAMGTHACGSDVIGNYDETGMTNETVAAWTDGVLDFAFASEPGAGTNSLTYVGSDGAPAEFVENQGVEEMARTYYIACACPALGGTLAFACDGASQSGYRWRLSRKGDGESAFAKVRATETIVDGKVSFSLDTLASGTYKLSRSPAGFVIVIR